jgi:hypothetical protein
VCLVAEITLEFFPLPQWDHFVNIWSSSSQISMRKFDRLQGSYL